MKFGKTGVFTLYLNTQKKSSILKIFNHIDRQSYNDFKKINENCKT